MLNKTQKDSQEKTELGRNQKIGLLILTIIFFLVILSLVTYGKIHSPGFAGCYTNDKLSHRQISANGTSVDVEVVERDEDKSKGLSGRDCLNKNAGMLFVFENTQAGCFWMKDMSFSIDMVWINKEGEIITIAPNVGPETYPKSYCPDGSAQYVLEVDSGFASESNWAIGTQFTL